jgi:tetratricopeptide (TPR) repeat protein
MKAGFLLGLVLLLAGCTSVEKDNKDAVDFDAIEWGRNPAYSHGIYDEVLNHLSKGRQKDAEWLLAEVNRTIPDSQRLIFLQAVLLRSRQDNTTANQWFSKTYVRGRETVPGRAAYAMVAMDSGYGVEYSFKTLKRLVDENPDEILLRWLYGMEARSHPKEAAAGDAQFKKILKKWKTGPVMLHRTYADLLATALGRPDEALEHRRLVTELEPEPWAYQELAGNLMLLQRFDEADRAYAKLLAMDPYKAAYWMEWGECCFYMGDFPSASEKLSQAVTLNPKDVTGLVYVGRCLEKMGRPEEAFGKYERAINTDPTHPLACVYAAHSKLYGYGTWPDYQWAFELCIASGAEFAKAGDTALARMEARINASQTLLAPEPGRVLLPRLVALAGKGNADAQFNLGMIYYHGIGIPRDWNKALPLLRKAAAQNHSSAKKMLKEFEPQ